MSMPAERPLPPPLTPPEKQCPECKGAGTLVAWLGETKPCPKCGGSGSVIEVVEEKLTAWQQEVVTLLRRIDEKLDHPMHHITFDASSAGPIPPELAQQMKKMGKP